MLASVGRHARHAELSVVAIHIVAPLVRQLLLFLILHHHDPPSLSLSLCLSLDSPQSDWQLGSHSLSVLGGARSAYLISRVTEDPQ